MQFLSSGLCGGGGGTGASAGAGIVVGAGVVAVVDSGKAIVSSAEASVGPSGLAAWTDAKARAAAAIILCMWCLPFDWHVRLEEVRSNSREVSHAEPLPVAFTVAASEGVVAAQSA